MSDGFEKIAAGAVDLGQRDERAAQIVAPAGPQLQHLQIDYEGVLRVGAGPRGHVAGRYHEIIRRGLAAIRALPARESPFGQHAGQGGVYGNLPGNLGFRFFQQERAERLQRCVVLPPAQASGFAMTNPRQGFQRVQHPAIFGDAVI